MQSKEGPREQHPGIGNSQSKSEVEGGMFTGQRGEWDLIPAPNLVAFLLGAVGRQGKVLSWGGQVSFGFAKKALITVHRGWE